MAIEVVQGDIFGNGKEHPNIVLTVPHNGLYSKE